MPAKGPVSIAWQTLYSVLPILDVYAAYKVKRLRWYLIITIAVGMGTSLIAGTLALGGYDFMDEFGEYALESDVGYGLPFTGTFASMVIHIGISIYLIRRWSKNWNRQFDDPTLSNR